MRDFAFKVAARRHAEGTLQTRIYFEPAPAPSEPASSGPSASTPPEPTDAALQDTIFATPPGDVEPAEVQGSKKAPTPEEIEKLKDTLSDFYNRWVEECQGADKFNGMTWAAYCPDTPAAREALAFIYQRGQEFLESFQNDCCRAHDVKGYPRVLRPWLAETEWTLAQLARRGWLPRSLLHPRDRAIRKPANEGGDELLDPGTLSPLKCSCTFFVCGSTATQSVTTPRSACTLRSTDPNPTDHRRGR